MKLKLTEDGNAVVEDGKVVMIDDDGDETAVDVIGGLSRLSEVNAEAARHRKAAKAAEEKLKRFEGIEDPDAAREALRKVSDFDDKDLLDADKAREMRERAIAETREAYEEKLAEREKDRESLARELSDLRTSHLFSEVGPAAFKGTIYERAPGHAERVYRDHVRFEDGQPVVYLDPGKYERPVPSKERPGDHADPAEALRFLIQQDPNRESLFLSNANGGGGAPNNGDGGEGGSKTMTRERFDQLPGADRMKFVRDGGRVTDAA